MKKLTLLLLFATSLLSAQVEYVYFSGGLDPKILLNGTENKYTTHDRGIDYLSKFGIRWEKQEVFGYVESYQDIGYKAIGLGFNHVENLDSFDLLIGGETSIISRKEIFDDGLNVKWLEYYPSFGLNAETRWNINKRFAIGWTANYRTRPDLTPYSQWGKVEIGRLIRFSTYIQIYIKL